MALPKTVIPIIVSVLVVASLAGGTYIGYSRGYAESAQTANPELDEMASTIQTLMETNANITAENEALRKAVPEIAGKTVKIACIAPSATQYVTMKTYFEKIIQPDINGYAASLGNGVSFEFVVLDAQGQAQRHLEIVQELHGEGISVFIGSGWSSQGCASLSYVKTNKMLMMSASSTSPTLAIGNDPLFRMCPSDSSLPYALADVLWGYGIREVVIIQRGDSWGDGIVNLFTPAFTSKGGTANKVRYNPETTDFCPYLLLAKNLSVEASARVGNDTSKVGVLLLSFDEAPQILQKVSQCEVLSNLTWFGADGTAKSSNIAASAPQEANQVKLFSLLLREPNSTRYRDLSTRYVAATGAFFSVYDGYMYDAAWVLAKSIIETGSDNATTITPILPSVCESYYGATGNCRLNEYGDRAPQTYDIWYYAAGDKAPSVSKIAGTYDPDTGATTWLIG